MNAASADRHCVLSSFHTQSTVEWLRCMTLTPKSMTGQTHDIRFQEVLSMCSLQWRLFILR